MNEIQLGQWIGLASAVLIAGSIIAVPAAFGVLRLYSRAVRRYMLASAGDPVGPALVPPAPAAAVIRARPTADVGEEMETEGGGGGGQRSGPALSPAAQRLYSRLLRGPQHLAVVYVIGGALHAAFMTAVFMWVNQAGLGRPVLDRFTALFWLVFAWPIVLTLAWVAVAGRRGHRALLAGYALSVLAVAGSRWLDAIGFFLLQVTIPTLFISGVINRRLRVAGPLMMLGAMGFAAALLTFPQAFLWAEARFAVFGDASIPFFAAGYVGAGLTIGLWFALRSGRRYRTKKVSDQMVLIGAWWLLFTVWESLMNVPADAPIGHAALGLPAFGIFLAVQYLSFRPLAREARRATNVRLLLLRTFGARRRSERLLRALGLHWRHVGSIQMIAGTDLAMESAEPHQFLDFLTGRLARQFVTSPQDLERRLASLDLEPDPDGRFRVNQLFCHDDTWQGALASMARLNDAVLMDLRAFGTGSRGCIHELQQLANLVPATRIVLLYDRTTDLHLLRHTLRHAWVNMDPDSPNRPSSVGSIRLLEVRGGRGDLRRLLTALCAAVFPLDVMDAECGGSEVASAGGRLDVTAGNRTHA
jgi:hypothetical protein